GFVIFAEDASHGVGDFADSGAGFDRVENSRHEVLAGLGGVTNRRDSALPRSGIAFGAQGADTLDLLALERLVDSLNRDWILVLLRKAVHADDRCFSMIDSSLIFVGGVLDFLLYEAALDGLQHSAESLDLI